MAGIRCTVSVLYPVNVHSGRIQMVLHSHRSRLLHSHHSHLAGGWKCAENPKTGVSFHHFSSAGPDLACFFRAWKQSTGRHVQLHLLMPVIPLANYVGLSSNNNCRRYHVHNNNTTGRIDSY